MIEKIALINIFFATQVITQWFKLINIMSSAEEQHLELELQPMLAVKWQQQH